MYGRIARFSLHPGQLDAAVRRMTEVTAPAFARDPAYRGRHILADRAANRVVAVIFFDTEAAAQPTVTAPEGLKWTSAEHGPGDDDRTVWEVAYHTPDADWDRAQF